MRAEFFEAGMLICFGCSWPANIIKSIRSRTAKGKTIVFSFFILAGYIFQITGKFISGDLTWVMIIYFVDVAMVLTDITLTLRNMRLDKRREVSA